MKITSSRMAVNLLNNLTIDVGTRLYSHSGIFEVIRIKYLDICPVVAKEVLSYDFDKDCECEEYLSDYEFYWTVPDLIGMEI